MKLKMKKKMCLWIEDGRNHFTLIELLVVIAIIAILASLLFPSLSKARDMGKSISCLNNLKNIYLGCAQYADDFNSIMPTFNNNGSGGHMIDYADHKKRNGPFYMNRSLGIGLPYYYGYLGKSPGVFFCPSDRDKSVGDPRGDGYTFQFLWDAVTSGIYTSYSYRCHFDFPSTCSSYNPKPLRFTNAKHAKAAVLSTHLGSWIDKISKRHGTGINAFFMDGHGAFHKDNGYLPANLVDNYENYKGWYAIDDIEWQ